MGKICEDFEELCKANQIDTEIGSDPYWRGNRYASPYTQGAWKVWGILHRKHKLGVPLRTYKGELFTEDKIPEVDTQQENP